MAFFVYIAILLVAISSILLELDWLTKPKLETKAPTQIVSTAAPPSAMRAKAKTEGPNADLSPVYPKKPDVPRSVASVTGAPQSAATAGAASAPAVTESAAKAEPPQKSAAEITGAATPPEQSTVGRASVASNDTNTPSAAATPPVPAANLAGPNRCDVQACSSAYQSFRASDCTYQPFEGGRRVCEKSPGTGQKVASQPREPKNEAAARRPNKDSELREVVRRVKQIAVPADEANDEDDDNINYGRDESRVIVIERPARRPW